MSMSNWLAEIRNKLADRTLQGVAPQAEHRRAGVLVPLYVREKELWLLFTKRSDKVLTHRGQVSFPGGAHETGDRDLKDTALRETEEELGLERKQIVLLGRLSPIVTVTNFYVEPYVAAIPYPAELKPSADEIEELWDIPISALMAPTAVEERMFEGRERPVLFYHYGQKTVWGATAQILSELLDALAGGERENP
jgi:8-oxo-dGTP pyrophosphatase MutT (NUDIX family)